MSIIDKLMKKKHNVKTKIDDNPVGKDVIVNGKLYKTCSGSSPKETVVNLKTKITRYQANARMPYNFTGNIGWASADSIKFID